MKRAPGIIAREIEALFDYDDIVGVLISWHNEILDEVLEMAEAKPGGGMYTAFDAMDIVDDVQGMKL